MSAHEFRQVDIGAARGPCGRFAIGEWTFLVKSPDWVGQDGPFGRFGTYCDWNGYADEIERHLRQPSRPVIVVGPNGSGKDAVAVEMARRFRKPFYLTTVTRQTTSTSLILAPVPPYEQKLYSLTGHTSAQVTGGLSCLTECGKNDVDFEQPLAGQTSAYDGHGVVSALDTPNVTLPVHPEHALLLLALPGDRLQGDLCSRAAFVEFAAPPPEVLIEIVQSNVPVADAMLLAALRDYASDRHAAGASLTPRACCLILTDAFKLARQGQANPLTAREARRLVERAATSVRV